MYCNICFTEQEDSIQCPTVNCYAICENCYNQHLQSEQPNYCPFCRQYSDVYQQKNEEYIDIFDESADELSVVLDMLDIEIDNHLNYFDRIQELIQQYIIADRFDINVMNLCVLDCIYLQNITFLDLLLINSDRNQQISQIMSYISHNININQYITEICKKINNELQIDIQQIKQHNDFYILLRYPFDESVTKEQILTIIQESTQ